ncbi:MAG: phosphoglycerate kinase [Spirochaetes bacterium]|nr:phosphoglycerate kinase [Spirochaetota bacterium]
MAIKYLKDLTLKGKRVMIRADFNVPYDGDMNITDDTRIRETIPTIQYCVEHQAAIIVVSHLGRPKGKYVPEMSLKPVSKRLSELMKREILFIEEEVGDAAAAALKSLKPGEVALMENIRFCAGEEKNDPELGKALASLADVFVNDAFAAAHRGHSSNDAITHYVKECAAGFLLENEIEYFKKAMDKPKRPLCAVIGGAKVSTKIDAMKNILTKVDYLLIGGGMAFTFLKAKGLPVGKSLLEEDLLDTAREIMAEAELKKVKLLLPVDTVAAQEFENDSPSSVVPVDEHPESMIGLDIGPETIKIFTQAITECKTVIWNGPLGAFEMPNFARGTLEVGRAIAASGAMSIIGGGDSVAAVNQAGLADKMSYISTGGGAFLELLEGKKLPAIVALDK